jgi:hypothetical protein
MPLWLTACHYRHCCVQTHSASLPTPPTAAPPAHHSDHPPLIIMLHLPYATLHTQRLVPAVNTHIQTLQSLVVVLCHYTMDETYLTAHLGAQQHKSTPGKMQR